MGENIVVGKRIPIGAIVGGLVGFAISVWNSRHPDAAISATDAVGLSTAAIGITQLVVVNFFGVTTK